MNIERNQLPYTICFCIQDDLVLMVKRVKSPNKDKWNGLGGKIIDGESPEETNAREVYEESELNLSDAISVKYMGIVTWDVEKTGLQPYAGGMHAYIARFSNNDIIFATRQTREGLLEWKPITWVLDKRNEELVDNEPLFLEHMIKGQEPSQYHCVYRNGKLEKFEVLPLPPWV